jgi:hypothetical protein
MNKTITLELRVEDAEPILRAAAKEAAEFGGLLDHVTRKTGGIRHQLFREKFDDARKRWHQRFAKAKRMVEAFGVEYEPTSEAETLTVDYRWIGGTTKVKRIPGIGPVGWTTGSQPDYAHPFPSYRGEVHAEACRQAASRVVRAWREVSEPTAKAA